MIRSSLTRNGPALLMVLAAVSLAAALAMHGLPRIGARLDQAILAAS